MKAFKGDFVKKNGRARTMVFARISDLPPKFVASKISGSGVDKKVPDGMELVWDIESDNFRYFNYNTQIGKLESIDIDLDFN